MEYNMWWVNNNAATQKLYAMEWRDFISDQDKSFNSW